MSSGLRQRGERWYAIVDYPRHPNGKRNQKEIALGKISKREAQKRRAQIVTEIATGNAVAPTTLTFGDYIRSDWLPAQKQRVQPKTYERWEEIMLTRVVPRLSGTPLRALTEQHLIAAYREWTATGNNGKPLAAQTVLHFHRAISQALKRAVKLRIVPRNVAENVGDELPRIERRETTTLTEEQVVTLQDAAVGNSLEVPIVVAIDTGARRGELLALRWSDVDLDAGRLAIRRSLEQTRAQGLRFKETKADRARTVALSEDTVAALRTHRAKQNGRRLRAGAAYEDGDLVFPRPDGTPWPPNYFGVKFTRLIARVPGVPKVRLHDLRHTSATIMLRAGVATKVVSERLGHSTTRLTTDTYQHVLAGMDEAAAERAGQALRDARARLFERSA